MSRILVIEPQRMLQHALVVALAPEHEVQLTGGLDKEFEVSGFDAAIVDLAALQEAGDLSKEALASLQDTRQPMVLIDGVVAVAIAERAGLVRLQAPIGREQLKAALRQCLSGECSAAAAVAKTARPKRAPRTPAPKKPKTEAPIAVVAEPQPGIIELTEIVEED